MALKKDILEKILLAHSDVLQIVKMHWLMGESSCYGQKTWFLPLRRAFTRDRRACAASSAM